MHRSKAASYSITPSARGRQRRAFGKGVWLVEATPDSRHTFACDAISVGQFSNSANSSETGQYPVTRPSTAAAARPACTCPLGDKPPPVGKSSKLRGPLGPIQRLAHGGGKLFGRQWLLNQFHVGIETPLMNDRVA